MQNFCCRAGWCPSLWTTLRHFPSDTQSSSLTIEKLSKVSPFFRIRLHCPIFWAARHCAHLSSGFTIFSTQSLFLSFPILLIFMRSSSFSRFIFSFCALRHSWVVVTSMNFWTSSEWSLSIWRRRDLHISLGSSLGLYVSLMTFSSCIANVLIPCIVVSNVLEAIFNFPVLFSDVLPDLFLLTATGVVWMSFWRSVSDCLKSGSEYVLLLDGVLFMMPLLPKGLCVCPLVDDVLTFIFCVSVCSDLCNVSMFSMLTSASCVEGRAEIAKNGYTLGPQSYPSSLGPSLRLTGPGKHERTGLARSTAVSDPCSHHALPDQGPKGLAPGSRPQLTPRKSKAHINLTPTMSEKSVVVRDTSSALRPSAIECLVRGAY